MVRKLVVLFGCVVVLASCVTTEPRSTAVDIASYKNECATERIGQKPAGGSTAEIATNTIVEMVTVTKIVDGDTIKVLIDEDGDGVFQEISVRFNGVSTPERGKRGAKPPTRLLKKLLLNQTVYLERQVDNDEPATGRYKRRLLRDVYVLDQVTNERIFVNALLVERGFAKVTPVGNNRKWNTKLKELQVTAKECRRGIWRENTAQPRSIGRKKKRQHRSGHHGRSILLLPKSAFFGTLINIIRVIARSRRRRGNPFTSDCFAPLAMTI